MEGKTELLNLRFSKLARAKVLLQLEFDTEDQVLSRPKMLSTRIFSTKYFLDSKFFGPINCLDPKFFRPFFKPSSFYPKFFLLTFCGTNFVFDPTIFQTLHNFWIPNFLDPTYISDSNFVWNQKNVRPKFFVGP